MLPTRRSIGIFSVSQRAFTPTCPGCPVISRYMDAAVRQEKGKFCFIKRKGKLFVLNIRSFCEKKFCFLGMRRCENENLWTFLRNSSSFSSFLPSFSSNTPAFFPFSSPVFLLLPCFSSSLRLSSPPLSVVFPSPFSRVCRCASADTRPRIAHSASSQFLPSPFTFTSNCLTICNLWVKFCAFFCLHR